MIDSGWDGWQRLTARLTGILKIKIKIKIKEPRNGAYSNLRMHWENLNGVGEGPRRNPFGGKNAALIVGLTMVRIGRTGALN